MATLFTIEGPLEVPFYQGRAGRTLTEDNVAEFWERNEAISSRRGCYVFGIRAGKGFTPGYVGKASKTFKQETFSPHKLAKYQRFLADYKKGTPVLFFATSPMKKGKPNHVHLGELEDFLIQIGLAANADLLNIKGTKLEEWGITGVLRSPQGKRSAAASQFMRMMKL